MVFTSGPENAAARIVIYGSGGIGKSTLAAYLPGPAFADVERGTSNINVSRDKIGDWITLRGKLAWLASNTPAGVRSVVVDTGTVAEELAKEHVLATRTTEHGKKVNSIDSFGWGKGWQFVYDEFNGLLADLDRINDKGIIVCLTSHVVSTVVPNPGGEDFLRWEPLLYGGDKKGRSSIRERVKNWADHVLFIAPDIHVADDNKAQGSGTRSVYTNEAPTHVAKSRTKPLAMPFTLDDPGAVWRELGIA